MFGKVTVLGPGLLGGSICLALSENKMSDRIVLWTRTKESCLNAQKIFPFAEVEENLAESVTGSELVIICTPVETICDIIEKIIPHLCKNALVTDVGSVKKIYVKSLKIYLKMKRLHLLAPIQWQVLKNQV